MLIISWEQMEAFELAGGRFEDEMIVHSKQFSPRLFAVIGEEQLLLSFSGVLLTRKLMTLQIGGDSIFLLN